MGNFIDLTNQKYGALTVIQRGENKYGRVAWICKCDCGNECHVTSNDLRTKKIVSCGCQKIKRITNLGIQNFKNIAGQKYGFLTVIEATEKRANKGEIIWKCKFLERSSKRNNQQDDAPAQGTENRQPH